MKYRSFDILTERDRERFGITGELTEDEWKEKQEELSRDINICIDIEGTPIIAGDIVEYESGWREYVFRTDDNGLAENACSLSWIKNGRREYGQEVYPQTPMHGFCGALVVDHVGTGSWIDGMAWFDHDLYWQHRLGNYEA